MRNSLFWLIFFEYETSLKVLYKITQALFNIIVKKKTMANSPKLHQIEKKLSPKGQAFRYTPLFTLGLHYKSMATLHTCIA